MTSCRCGLPSFGYAECYYHAKAHVDWTTRPPAPNGLSPEERAFVGIYPPPRRNGWHSAGEWAQRLDLDLDVDPERVAMLRILVRLGGMDELPSV